MEFGNQFRRVGKILSRFPRIVFRTISFPAYKVLKFPVVHAAIQDGFNLIFWLTIICQNGVRMVRLWPFSNGVWMPATKERDMEHRVNPAEVIRQCETLGIAAEYFLYPEWTKPSIVK